MSNPFKIGDKVVYHSEKCNKSFYKSAEYYVNIEEKD